MRVHSHSVTCTAAFVQWAGVAALEGPQEPVAEMVAAYDRRRRRLAEALSRIDGLRCPLLEEAHVAVTPGSAFGRSGEGHMRLAFAASDEALDQAVDRIECLLRRG